MGKTPRYEQKKMHKRFQHSFMSSFIELIESLLSIIHLLQRIRNEQLLSAVIDKILKNTENEFIFGIRFVGFGKKIQNNGNL